MTTRIIGLEIPCQVLSQFAQRESTSPANQDLLPLFEPEPPHRYQKKQDGETSHGTNTGQDVDDAFAIVEQTVEATNGMAMGRQQGQLGHETLIGKRDDTPPYSRQDESDDRAHGVSLAAGLCPGC